MFGAFFGKHKDDVKPAEGYSRFRAGEPPTDTVDHEGYHSSLGHLGLALLNGTLFIPKTYERLIHDLYVAGWTIEEVKALLGGKDAEATDNV